MKLQVKEVFLRRAFAKGKEAAWTKSTRVPPYMNCDLRAEWWKGYAQGHREWNEYADYWYEDEG